MLLHEFGDREEDAYLTASEEEEQEDNWGQQMVPTRGLGLMVPTRGRGVI
jgi:hypothetical protein